MRPAHDKVWYKKFYAKLLETAREVPKSAINILIKRKKTSDER